MFYLIIGVLLLSISTLMLSKQRQGMDDTVTGNELGGGVPHISRPRYTAFEFVQALGRRNGTEPAQNTPWPSLPPQYAPLRLKSTNLASVFRIDYPWDELFDAWSLFTMTSNTAMESWTSNILCLGDLSDFEPLAGGALVTASTQYPVFQDTYQDLVNSRNLVELFIGCDISEENWNFEADPALINQHKYAYFLKDENVYLVSPIFAFLHLNFHAYHAVDPSFYDSCRTLLNGHLRIYDGMPNTSWRDMIFAAHSSQPMAPFSPGSCSRRLARYCIGSMASAIPTRLSTKFCELSTPRRGTFSVRHSRSWSSE